MENNRTPVGLTSAVMAVKSNCREDNIYKKYGVKPPHYILNLDSGEGQTTFTRYVADSYYSASVRRFGGLDLFLEYRLDGSMDQLNAVFSDISGCAVYTNRYEGVVGIDISELEQHINESQIETFKKNISAIGKDATMIFYISHTGSRNRAILVSIIENTLGNVDYIELPNYSKKELVEILKLKLNDFGISIRQTRQLDKVIYKMMAFRNIESVRDVEILANELMGNLLLHLNCKKSMETRDSIDLYDFICERGGNIRHEK